MGDANGGSNNLGSDNLGSGNCGDGNSGSYNSGDCNTGNDNYGDENSGNNNLGSGNQCNNNKGDGNQGDNNLGSFNLGSFNLVDGVYGYFNQIGAPTTTSTLMFDQPCQLSLPVLMQLSGCRLMEQVPIDREERQVWWEETLTDADRQDVKKLPNYDKAVFKACTGIIADRIK